MARNDSEIVDKIVSETTDEEIVLDTKHGDIEFSLDRLPRRQRVETMRALPDAMIEATETAQQSDADSAAEVQNEIDVSAEMIPTAEAVDKLEQAIVDGLDHPSLAPPDIRDLLGHADDEVFMGLGFWVLGKSGDVDGVAGFREK